MEASKQKKNKKNVFGFVQEAGFKKEQASNTDPSKEIKDLEKKTEEKISKIVEDFNSKIQEKETKTTEILAIFITLFTFISVNVNIYTKIQDVQSALWFLLLITICSIVLVSYLFIIIGKGLNRTTTWGLIISLLILIFLLFFPIYFHWNPKLNSETIINNLGTNK